MYCDQALRGRTGLTDRLQNSSGFQGYTPSDDISVYGALQELGCSELRPTFQRSLQKMYKFKVLGRELA